MIHDVKLWYGVTPHISLCGIPWVLGKIGMIKGWENMGPEGKAPETIGPLIKQCIAQSLIVPGHCLIIPLSLLHCPFVLNPYCSHCLLFYSYLPLLPLFYCSNFVSYHCHSFLLFHLHGFIVFPKGKCLAILVPLSSALFLWNNGLAHC